jgi:hypothetical protein
MPNKNELIEKIKELKNENENLKESLRLSRSANTLIKNLLSLYALDKK